MNKPAIGRFALAARTYFQENIPDQHDKEMIGCQLFFHLIAFTYMQKNQMLHDHAGPEELYTFLPELFVPMPYSDLLTGLTASDSPLRSYSDEIPEEDWMRVEILGWLYQAYQSPDKDAAFELLRKNQKIPNHAIPAATQLFTPDWVVRYLVQNSLGKLWQQIAPNSPLLKEMDFFLPTEQSYASEHQLETLRIIDPCMGSGHILVYAFRLLLRMYREKGYEQSQAVRMILKNNLYGLDIDPRVTQIAHFALLMLAYRYDPEILHSTVRPQIYAISANADEPLPDWAQNTVRFGSLTKIPANPEFSMDASRKWQQIAKILGQQYHVVVTNPPYMGKKSLNDALSRYLTAEYPEGKSELYAAFLLRCIEMTASGGYTAMITIHSWMFIRSYEPLRRKVLHHTHIDTLLHCGAATFDELNAFNVLASAFCLQKAKSQGSSLFVRLCEALSRTEKIHAFHQPQNHFWIREEKFHEIPGMPFVYHISEQAAKNFKSMPPLRAYSKPKQGIATADNKQFVRYWFEVPREQICFDAATAKQALQSKCRFFPYNKGGNYRKWYGMNEYVIDWEEDGKRIKDSGHAVLRNMEEQFRSGITWSLFGFENFSVRYKTPGFLFDVSGSSIFPKEEDTLYTLAFLASKVAFLYLSVLAPTVNFQVGNIGDLPFYIDSAIKPEIDRLAAECIRISKEEWDDYEESWDFTVHPLLRHKKNTLEESFSAWAEYANQRYDRFVQTERKIHRLFIRSYRLEAVLTDEIPQRDIAIRKADYKQDIQSFLSYAVGCVFGRYACDAIRSVDNNLLTPIELAKQVSDMIRNIWGTEHYDANLQFLAASLGKKGTPIQVLEQYFRDKFYIDHLKTYKKHPIYWMYDNGEKNGFRAYFYLHRFTPEQMQAALKIAIDHGCGTKWEKAMTTLIAQNISFDRNDGVQANYRKLESVLAKLR